VARGATVLGTASPRHTAYLRSIGVSRVINYASGNVAAQAGQIDTVIDTVGGNEALQALAALGAGGRFVSIARAQVTPAQCADRQVQCLGSPGSAAHAPAAVMLQVAQLAQDGNLRVHVDRTYPLARAAEALRYNHQGHTEGKVILAVTRQANAR
jgi:NADPH:quinone reductase-like Zn-dependent oxidoreductase